MTPKEKAEELVNAIENKTHSLVKDEEAKICALICVDEIIKQNNIWISQTGKGTNNVLQICVCEERSSANVLLCPRR